MLTGENDAAVTESCLLWLKEMTTRKVEADWAKREEDVFQVSVSSISPYLSLVPTASSQIQIPALLSPLNLPFSVLSFPTRLFLMYPLPANDP